MQQRLSALLVGLSLSAFALAGQQLTGTISKIVDGDTVWFDHETENGDEETLKIRMVNMDTPELHLAAKGKGVVSQGHYAEEATDNLQKLTPLKTRVELESFGLDRYKRTLGVIYKKGLDINLEQVKQGLAVPYVLCTGTDCNPSYLTRHRIADYFKACDEAKKQQRGIFSAKDPLKETPYEFRLRMGNRQPDKFTGDYDTKVLYEAKDFLKVDVCRRVFFYKLADAKKLGFAKKAE